ncbi:acetyl-CoA carboxylase biotin carboxyl carrier protein [Crassaminicella profunda]|uniref:acetyl-CoA carboxylase biotin carboxyl carrier protein n=1 Tax=Crassaminicella profunda TaxID=1286698 RepID=UPI001CA75779|nr:acetyl-CoA carboxylase biotin carboxyl carrier protein [Crassaminicella profunda]QZY54488.1 acetyl-CoA carboxylase biotin carboxyl carrier protein [Crassaminicella profunda]
MNIKDIKELLLTIDQTSIERVDIQEKDLKISVTKSVHEYDLSYESNKNEIKIEKPVESIKEEILVEEEELYIVKSPIVGVFYATPSPDAQPFVEVGDTVEKGQPICIIEAMKIMNEIQSEESGQVVELLVENEDIVEYGQPLMKIRR